MGKRIQEGDKDLMQEGNCGERDARKKLWRKGRGK